jgi:hypothetical protein
MEAEGMGMHWGEAESIEGFIEDHAFSRGGMIWLPSLVSKLDSRNTGILRKRDNMLTGKGGRGWARSRITRSQENLVLYQTFNTLWGEVYTACKCTS